MVLDHRIALDYLLIEQGGDWAIANVSCFTWITGPGTVANTRHRKIVHLAKIGWCPFGYILWFIWHQLVWFMGALTNAHTLVSCLHSPESHQHNLPGVLCSLRGLKYMVMAISSMSDDTADGAMLGERETRWTVRWTEKTILPWTWHRNLRLSWWDQNNFTLMVTENVTNTKSLVNLSRVRGWPKGGNC